LLSSRGYINLRAGLIDRARRAGYNEPGMERKEEILAKLAQIQEQAQLTLDELPLRLAKDRLRLIIGLARYLTTAVDLSRDASPAGAGEGDAKRLPAAPRA
jgi:hypothetical protein